MNYILLSLSQKPFLGVAAGLGGGLASLLSKLQLISPLIGFLAAVVGLGVASCSLILKIKDLKESFKHRK